MRQITQMFPFMGLTEKDEKPRSSVIPLSLLCGCLSSAAVLSEVLSAATERPCMHDDGVNIHHQLFIFGMNDQYHAITGIESAPRLVFPESTWPSTPTLIFNIRLLDPLINKYTI